MSGRSRSPIGARRSRPVEDPPRPVEDPPLEIWVSNARDHLINALTELNVAFAQLVVAGANRSEATHNGAIRHLTASRTSLEMGLAACISMAALLESDALETDIPMDEIDE
jgi:hypothetical protein